VPVTTIPAQVLKVVAAGIALSPYQQDADYSQTAVRQSGSSACSTASRFAIFSRRSCSSTCVCQD
jgi:hypothetical protein